MKSLKTVFLTLLTIAFFITCKKEFSYESGNIGLTSGTWQFVNNAIQYGGNIDSAFIQDAGGTKELVLEGKSLSGQENFLIRLYTIDSFTTASYRVSLSESVFDYFTSSKTIFKADVLSGDFTVTITSLSSNRITGTFSGDVEDSTGAKTVITLGRFTSAIDLSNNGSGGNASEGTLGANPDTCTPVILSNNFTQGIAFSALNTVQVQVNVSSAGTYLITTDLVNGVKFSKAGTFTNTGIQSVTLVGSGTPQDQGIQYFTVTYGNSNCVFPAAFLPGTPSSSDYFPSTINSYWVYSFERGYPIDSLLTRVISYAPTFGGKSYSSFVGEDIPSTDPIDTMYFRKSSHDYFHYLDVSDIFPFDNPVKGEYVFLNDTASINRVIRSPDFDGTISGVAATGYIEAVITQKGATVSINGINYTDVIKVRYQYYLSAQPGVPVSTEIRWFARDIGLIFNNIDSFIIQDIARYNVI